MIHSHFRYSLIAVKKQWYATISSVFGTLAAVALILLGYKVLGVTGASIDLVVGEVVVWFNSWLFSRKCLHMKSHLRNLVRPLICTVSLLAVIRILLAEEIPTYAQR